MNIKVGEYDRAPVLVSVMTTSQYNNGILPVVTDANDLVQTYYFGDELDDLRVAILEEIRLKALRLIRVSVAIRSGARTPKPALDRYST